MVFYINIKDANTNIIINIDAINYVTFIFLFVYEYSIIAIKVDVNITDCLKNWQIKTIFLYGNIFSKNA